MNLLKYSFLCFHLNLTPVKYFDSQQPSYLTIRYLLYKNNCSLAIILTFKLIQQLLARLLQALDLLAENVYFHFG